MGIQFGNIRQVESEQEEITMVRYPDGKVAPDRRHTVIPLRTWIEILKREGVLTILVLIFSYFITTKLDAGVNGNTDAIKEMKSLLQQHTTVYQLDTQTIKYILRVQCIHAAHNDTERAECTAAALDQR